MKYPFHQEVSIQPSDDIIVLRLREKMGSSHITWHKGTHSVRSPHNEMILQPQNCEIFWGWGGQAALHQALLHENKSHGELPLCFWSLWWPSWQFSLCFRHVAWKSWQMTRFPLLPCTTDVTQVSRVSSTLPISSCARVNVLINLSNVKEVANSAHCIVQFPSWVRHL